MNPETISVKDYTIAGCTRALVAAARQFVARVEAGEVRSRHTYETLKEILRIYDAVRAEEPE